MTKTLDLWERKGRGHPSEIRIEQIAHKWHHDPVMLDAFYEVVLRNWKEFHGVKPRALQPKISAALLQINRGDFVDESHLSVEAAIRGQTPAYRNWKSLIGTTKDTAKRRFITLMRSIDEELLEIKLKPPGYALTTKEGEPVCPWANTERGCPLPLLSKDGTPLPQVIDKKFHSLRKADNLRRWIGHNEDHACELGMHLPLTPAAVLSYLPWFRQKICGGFKAYDFVAFRQLVKSIVDRQAAQFQELMTRSHQYLYAEVEAELDILLGMKKVYEIYAKEEYVYEVPCTRTIFHCEQRRKMDGGVNHKHPIIFTLANATFSSAAYDKVIEVREECRAAGLNPKTGVMRDPERRYRVLKERLISHQKRVAAGEEARERLEQGGHKAQARALIPTRAKTVLNDNLQHAISKGMGDHIKRAIHLGAYNDTETSEGMTALIRAVLQGDVKLAKELVKECTCAINYMNKKGMTALSWACMMGETSIVETLMDLGADPSLEGSNNRTPFMLAVEHNHSLVIELILEHLFKGNRGSRGVDQVLNQKTSQGNMTSLILATKQRNWGMIRLLLRKNAGRLTRTAGGQTAEVIARQAGWIPIADFLRTTRAVGPNGFYSATDEQEEKDIQEMSKQFSDYLRNNGVSIPAPAVTDQRSSSAFSTFKETGRASPRSSRSSIEDFETRKISSYAATKDLRVLSSAAAAATTSSSSRPSDLRKSPSQAEDGTLHPLLKLIRTNRVSPNLETEDGSTALICAACAGELELARTLLAEGAILDYENRNGKTALMAAASGGSYDMVLELLSRGADINKEDVEGRTCTYYASQVGHERIVPFLKNVRLHGLDEGIKRYQAATLQEEAKASQERQQALLEKYGLNNRTKTEKEGGGATAIKRIAKADIALRCWKCTLFVPCAHFANKEELRKSLPQGIEVAWRWHNQPKGLQNHLRARQRRRLEYLKAGGAPLPSRRSTAGTNSQSSQTLPSQQGMPTGEEDFVQEEETQQSEDTVYEENDGSHVETETSTHDVVQDFPSTTISSGSDDVTGTEPVASVYSATTVTSHQSWDTPDGDDEYHTYMLQHNKPKTPPLRLIYANVRRLLTPPNQPRDHSNPHWQKKHCDGSELLHNLGKSDAPLVQLLRHGTTLDDLTLIWAQDKYIMNQRAIPEEGGDRGRNDDGGKYPSYGFMSVDIRRGVCLYPPCSRCGIGFAKLMSETLSAPVCDVCALVSVATAAAASSDTASLHPQERRDSFGRLSHIRPSSSPGGVDGDQMRRPSYLDPEKDMARSISVSVSSPPAPPSGRPTSSQRRRGSLNKRMASDAPAVAPLTFARKSSLALPSSALKKKARRVTAMFDDIIVGRRTSLSSGSGSSNVGTPTRPRAHSASMPSSPVHHNDSNINQVRKSSFNIMDELQGVHSPQKKTKQESPMRKSSSGILNSVRDELVATQMKAQADAREKQLREKYKTEMEAVKFRRNKAAIEADCYYRATSLDLGEFLIARRRIDEAEGLLFKSLDVHISLYGPYHISIALLLRLLGQLEEARGVFPLARAYRETSYEILAVLFGPIHCETIRAVNLLARTLTLQEYIPEAVHFYREMCRQLHSYRVKRYREVGELFQDNLDKLEAKYGPGGGRRGSSAGKRKMTPPPQDEKGDVHLLRRVSLSTAGKFGSIARLEKG